MNSMLCLVLLLVTTVSAGTFTVGSGTASSCTENALDTALASALGAAGSTVNFNCGSNIVTIPITKAKWIDASITINGGDKVILDAKSQSRHFVVANKNTMWGLSGTGISFNLKSIELKNGWADKTVKIGKRDANYGLMGGKTNTQWWITRDGGCILFGQEVKINIDNTVFRKCEVKSCSRYTDPNNSVMNSVTCDGGAFVPGKTSTLTITNTEFRDCLAENGQGGAFFAKWKTGKVSVTNTKFYGNVATLADEAGGGAVKLHSNEDAQFHNCVFENGKASCGGGIYNLLSNLWLDNCKFFNNEAKLYKVGSTHDIKGRGGALYVDGAGTLDYPTGLLKVTDTYFGDNQSDNKGGAVYLCIYNRGNKNDKGVFTGDTFCNNVVTGTDTHEATGGGFQYDCSGSVSMSGAHFKDNKAIHGTVASRAEYCAYATGAQAFNSAWAGATCQAVPQVPADRFDNGSGSTGTTSGTTTGTADGSASGSTSSGTTSSGTTNSDGSGTTSSGTTSSGTTNSDGSASSSGTTSAGNAGGGHKHAQGCQTTGYDIQALTGFGPGCYWSWKGSCRGVAGGSWVRDSWGEAQRNSHKSFYTCDSIRRADQANYCSLSWKDISMYWVSPDGSVDCLCGGGNCGDMQPDTPGCYYKKVGSFGWQRDKWGEENRDALKFPTNCFGRKAGLESYLGYAVTMNYVSPYGLAEDSSNYSRSENSFEKLDTSTSETAQGSSLVPIFLVAIGVLVVAVAVVGVALFRARQQAECEYVEMEDVVA